MLPRSIPFGVLLGVLPCVGCRHPPSPGERDLSRQAKEFKAELLAALSDAQRVDVVEHSWRYDFFDETGEFLKDPPEIEYRRTELTPGMISSFRAAFEQMSESPKTTFSLCIFEPHHSIEMMDEDGSVSVIQVCFKCDDTEWEGRSVVPPKDFQAIFRRLIEPLGFEASREWDELAKAKPE